MELEGWHDLFVASAGAAAALAGLIIVSMSVNIRQILATKSMPSRAGASIAALVLIVVVSIGALIPAQAEWMLGLESLGFGLIALAFAVDATVRLVQESIALDAARTPAGVGLSTSGTREGSTAAASGPDAGADADADAERQYRRPLSNLIVTASMSILQVLPFVVGGLVLLAGGGVDAGLSWIAAGILFVFIGAVVNAWVMLVEILR